MKTRYFHIQKLNSNMHEWFINDKFSTNEKSFNTFYSGIVSTSGKSIYLSNNENIGLIKYSNSVFKKFETTNDKMDAENEKTYYLDKSSEYENLNIELQENLFHYLKWIREEIFENVRISNFANLPSRKKCIWLTSLNNLPKWWEIIQFENRKILEIEISNFGKTHHADATLIEAETLSIKKFEEMAHLYWSGKKLSDLEPEVLFEGNFKIINEYKNFEDII